MPSLSMSDSRTSELLQILPSDWLSYSRSIGNIPSSIAKGINFQIQK